MMLQLRADLGQVEGRGILDPENRMRIAHIDDRGFRKPRMAERAASV